MGRRPGRPYSTLHIPNSLLHMSDRTATKTTTTANSVAENEEHAVAMSAGEQPQNEGFYHYYTPEPGGLSYLIPASNMPLSMDSAYRYNVLHSAKKLHNESYMGGIKGPGGQLNFMNPYEFMASGVSGENSHHGDCNLFIFHLPSSVDNYCLYRLFSKFGEILSVKVIIDLNTGLSRGYGFVSYSHKESADLAISCMNGFLISRKRLKVQYKRRPADAPANHHSYSQGHVEQPEEPHQHQECQSGNSSRSGSDAEADGEGDYTSAEDSSRMPSPSNECGC